MAEDKKSFVLYAEYIELVEELSDEDAGQLMKHLFKYVNDQNPTTDNRFVKLAFIPMKQALKRDLKKWEAYKHKQSENGKKGGRPQKPKETQKTQPFLEEPKKAVNVNVNANVNELPNGNYGRDQFLEDWNELRTKHLKKPSHLNRLPADDISNLKDLIEDYSREDIRNGLIGLFRQKQMPNGNTTMQSDAKHFLTHFNRYLTAFHDKNESLYGKKEKELI